METIEGIVAEMREFADTDSQSIGRDVLRRRIQHFADSIEQAVTNCNQLKMRETVAETEKSIDKAISILEQIPETCGFAGILEDACDVLCSLKEEFVKPALAEPPRNCDLYATEDEAWQAFCGVHPDAKCPSDYWSEQYQLLGGLFSVVCGLQGLRIPRSTML